MADRPHTGIPSPNWRWPLESLDGVRAFADAADAMLKAGGELGRELAQLRQDRDELVAALERALERSAPEHLLSDVEREEQAEDCVLLERVKGR